MTEPTHTQTKEQRRVGFELPAEVYEQLLTEIAEIPGESFWDSLHSYYQLSSLQGDTCICSPDFVQYIETTLGDDKPTWVYEQGSLKKMQCMIIAGPTRGQILLDTLKLIEKQREEGERERREDTRKLEAMFQDEGEDTYDY